MGELDTARAEFLNCQSGGFCRCRKLTINKSQVDLENAQVDILLSRATSLTNPQSDLAI